MTSRARLALAFALVGVVASALVGLFAFRATERELDSSTDDFLVERAEEIASGTRRSPGERPGRRSDQEEALRLAVDADSIAQTITATGDVLSAGDQLPVTSGAEAMAALRPGRISTKNVRFDDVEVDGESFRMVSLALPDGGAVQVARATGEADDVVSELVVRIALIAVVVALLGGVVGWWLARRATRPLRRLASVAGEVAATRDFSAEIDVGGDREVRQLADAFSEMLAALDASREQQHRLVHDAGHELRTPLTSLRANAALLERFERLDDDDRREVIEAVNGELVELVTLVDELIDLATDQQDVEMVADDVDLSRLAERVVERWQRRTDRPIDVDAEPTVVRGDDTMLDRALTNLLGNADKFSPPGAPVLVIVRSGSVVVRDRGPGVPEEERERIFDRFHRSEHTRSMPGSGLGLAIVAQIVERHQGTVIAREAPGGGAEIGFSLPVVD